MKRFAPLALVVLALAAVPAAFADDGSTPSAPTASGPAATRGAHVPMRLEILRLRMQVVSLRFRLHCGQNGNASQDRCAAFAQKALDHLTTLDRKVQDKLAQLKACTADSTDATCKNADRKIAVLTRVDQRLQNAIAKVQAWLSGNATASTSDSSLDAAAGSLAAAAAGSNG